MAEAAGLAVGIAGLAVSFKACIELFDCFYTARSLDHDFCILVTKLDIEKTMLLQWGEKMGLFHPQFVDQPVSKDVLPTALPILRAIKALLCNGKKLQTRYAVRALKRGQENDYERCSTIMSNYRLLKLTVAFERLNVDPDLLQDARLTDHENGGTRVPFDRFRWAVHDKGKFNTLIADLSYFVSSLRELFPAPRSEIRQMHAEDLSNMQSAAKVSRVKEAAGQRDSELAQGALHRLDQLAHPRILDCLWFRRMTDRRDSLSPPSPKTFDWALSEDTLPAGWSSLPSWLKSSSGIYWVSGKAAAGKSTLMKFIGQHGQTSTLLRTWTGKSTLTVASFYFYHLGTTEQKSQQGLCRLLLHQILTMNPALTKELLPDMWREARRLEDDEPLALPSTREMKYAFQNLAAPQSANGKFCFFIDGLDEFSGDLSDGIDIIKTISGSPNVKVLVSSRPLQACVRAFSSVPKLCLADLTRGDMLRYIDQKLGSHPYLSSLQRQDRSFFKQLRTELVRKASGVFLWITLVCRNLLQGFDNYDRPTELQQRISELPDELGELFEHMLKKISRPYQIYAFSVLQICRANHDLQDNELDVLSFALADQHELDVSRLGEIHPRDEKGDLEKCLAFEGRIRSRCRGLVETVTTEQSSCTHDQSHFDTLFQICQDCDRGGMCTHEPDHAGHATKECDTCKEQRLKSKHVEFIHRSLLEYMDSDEFDRFSSQMKLNELYFDPYVALLCVIFHSSVTKLLSSRPEPVLSTHLLQCLGKVQSASIRSMKHLCIELGRFNRDPVALIGHFIYNDRPESNREWLRKLNSDSVALLLAAEFQSVDLFDAVWEEIGKPDLSSTRLGSSPLYHAQNQPFLKACRIAQDINIDIVRHLYRAGGNPSEGLDLGNGGLRDRARKPYDLERVLDSGTDPCQLELYHDPGAPRPDVRADPLQSFLDPGSPETPPAMDLSQFFFDAGPPETPLSMDLSHAGLYHISAAPLAVDLSQPHRYPVAPLATGLSRLYPYPNAPLCYARPSIPVHAGVSHYGTYRSSLVDHLAPESTSDATGLWISSASPVHVRDQLEASTLRQSICHSSIPTGLMPSIQLSDTIVDTSGSKSRLVPATTLSHGSQHSTKKRHAHDCDGGGKGPPEKYPRIYKRL